MASYKPGMPDLAGAVAAFMKATVQPALEGKQAYEARIAANLLGIIRRELEQGEQSRAAELAGLQQVLGHEGSLQALNDELCERIRNSAIDYRDAGFMCILRASVLGRLAIDNPGYSAYLQAKTQA